MQRRYITIKNNNFDESIDGFTEVFLSPPNKIRIKDKDYNFVGIESLGVSSNKSVQKDVGNTIARGILGGALLGPLGAISGLMVGRNKVTGFDEYIYKVNLAGDKYFIFSDSKPDIDFHSLTSITSIQYNESSMSSSNKEIPYNGPERLRESFLLHYNLPHAQLVQLMGNIEHRVKKIVADQWGLNEDDISNDWSFADDLDADELDILEIIMGLEEYLGCEIPDKAAKKITTVQLAINYVNNHVNGIKKVSQKNSIVEELKELAELRNSGVLTEEEFQSQKRKLLNM